MNRPKTRVSKLLVILLLVIFGGIVLHAPLTVVSSTLWPEWSLLFKSWKEILMLVAGILLLIELRRHHKAKLILDPLIYLIGLYGLVHIILIPVGFQGLMPTLAGLMIDLRYVFFFALVYLTLKMYPGLWKPFLKVGLAGALVVVVFAILQVTVLPNDFLKYLGYGDKTIQPYLLVDMNPAFVRINSTLRGPNSLGAYLVIVLPLVLAYLIQVWRTKLTARRQVVLAILSAGGLVAMWFSYSRSAWLGLVLAVAAIVAISLWRKLSMRTWAIICGLVLVIAVGGWLMRGTNFVSNVLFHNNQQDASGVNSDYGHIASLSQASHEFWTQPLGAGIGSTGSASMLGSHPLVIENQYFFIAHEAGWLGLALFVFIWLVIFMRLWQKRTDWLSLGVLAGGIGLVVASIALPTLADDTVAIVWFGLAAVALTREVKK